MKAINDFFVKPKYKLLIASDHCGYILKNKLFQWLDKKGLNIEDLGPNRFDKEDDYPDFAIPLAKAISQGKADCGILICCSGVGMAICANRFSYVHAVLGYSFETVKASRLHNCSNVLVIAVDHMNEETILPIIDTWLTTAFSNKARHQRRLTKIQESNRISPTTVVCQVDEEIASWLKEEEHRQEGSLELIASENIASQAVQAAMGSCLTNKYAEGYPRKRYYGGCEYVDEIEQIAIERAKRLFEAEAANVQAHSGSQANMASYFALLKPGERILAMDLSHGGHLTHGFQLNFSGRLFDIIHYGVDAKSEMINYDEIRYVAKKKKPRLIVAGSSTYPRIIDFEQFRHIADEIGAYFMVDMAHIAGLVATGHHPSPIPYADVVTSTTHKTLRGPRGGLILSKEKYIKKINSHLFPGIQGGPLMHVIAAKAVCFKEAMNPEYRQYQRQVLDNAKHLATQLDEKGFRIVSGGTDNHIVLLDLRPLGCTGRVAERALDDSGITVNKNLIPFDPEKAMISSGLRLGTPVVSTRGMKKREMEQIAEWIHQVVVTDPDDTRLQQQVRSEVYELTQRFPILG